MYIHTNALMFRNLRLQEIDPFASGVTIDDNLLTAQFFALWRNLTICQIVCLTIARQKTAPFTCAASTKTLCWGCFMIYELQKVDKSMFPSSLVRMIYEYTELYKARKDPQLAEVSADFYAAFPQLSCWPSLPPGQLQPRSPAGAALVRGGK